MVLEVSRKYTVRVSSLIHWLILEQPFLVKMSERKSQKPKRGNNLLLLALAPVFVALAIIVGVPVTFCIKNGESLLHAIPYALLFTGFREQTKAAWALFGTPVDLSIKKQPVPLPVILAEDYTYEKLQEVTQNFHIPAVVKGLFKDQPAIKKWHEAGYLKSKLGEFEVRYGFTGLIYYFLVY